MIPHTGLHAIATGAASLEEAHDILEGLRGEAGRGVANRIYRSLLDWTWSAIYSRRLDPEVLEWMDLIRGIEADLNAALEPEARLLGVLGDLLEKSVLFAESNSDEALMRFAHLAEILGYIRRLNGRADRRDIAAAMKIGNSRLSQLLSTLVKTGKLDCEQRGKEAVFHLTTAGTALVDQLLEQRQRNATRLRASPPFEFDAAKESFRPSLFPSAVRQEVTTTHSPVGQKRGSDSENFELAGQARRLVQPSVPILPSTIVDRSKATEGPGPG